MKNSQRRNVSYNKKLKLWELHDKNSKNTEFVKTKEHAKQWLSGEIGNGNCYEVSAKIILDSKGSKPLRNPRLCHGTVCGQGPLEGAVFGHSWIEYEQTLPIDEKFKETFPDAPSPSITIVLDRSNGKNLEIPAPLYYLTGKIDSVKVLRYNQDQTRKNILIHGHWGPWE
jgi:hypothetical protein